MSKAILILDMPARCMDCRFFNKKYDNEYGWHNYCGADYHRMIDKNDKYFRYFCPLKPLPEKKDTHGRYIENQYIETAYEVGWNDCISEILEGEEE